jgi:hypothetical protein
LNKALRIASIIGALILASGCGGSAASTDSVASVDSVVTTTDAVAPVATDTTQLAVMPVDLGAYANTVGCTSYEKKATPISYVSEWGYCKFEDVTVQVYAFASPLDLASFVEMLLSSGGKEEDTVTKGLVLFAPDSAAKVEPLRKALGA